MYNQGQQQLAQSPDMTKVTFTSSLKNEIQDINDRQTNTISAIIDKLHDILNKRMPQSESANKDSNPISDFSSAIGSELVRLRVNTNKLEDIYSHLCEII